MKEPESLPPIYIGALATIVAAFLAFLLNVVYGWITSWLKRPKLSVKYTHSSPDAMLLPLTDGGYAYYFRLQVENKGRTAAKSVEVYASSLKRKNEDGEFKEVSGFIPMNLAWSHGKALLAEDTKIGRRLIYFPAISRHMKKHCDIGHIFHHKAIPPKMASALGIKSQETVFNFDLMVVPTSLSDMITKGEYILTIVVAAMNAKPKKKTLYIQLSGKWFDNEHEMFDYGIKIKLVKRI